MHINLAYQNPEIIIREEIIKDGSVKNILPIYLTLFVMDNPVANKKYWQSITVRELCSISNIYKGITPRRSHYENACIAITKLESYGYVELDGFDNHNLNSPFRYRITDFYKTDENGDTNRYLKLTVNEFMVLSDKFSMCDLPYQQIDTAWRVYCCLRFFMRPWQKTYKNPYPAWVGKLDSVSNWLGISRRTQTRVFGAMQDFKVLFVTYGARTTKTEDFCKRPDTIVVFPLISNGKACDVLTRIVEIRVRDKKGMSQCTWYAPGQRVIRKEKEEDQIDGAENISIKDIEDATEKNLKSIASAFNNEEDIF